MPPQTGNPHSSPPFPPGANTGPSIHIPITGTTSQLGLSLVQQAATLHPPPLPPPAALLPSPARPIPPMLERFLGDPHHRSAGIAAIVQHIDDLFPTTAPVGPSRSPSARTAPPP